MEKITESDMDNDEHLLITIYDGRDAGFPHLVKCAVTIKDGAVNQFDFEYWRMDEEFGTILSALPIHVKDIGQIVAVERLFWSG